MRSRKVSAGGSWQTCCLSCRRRNKCDFAEEPGYTISCMGMCVCDWAGYPSTHARSINKYEDSASSQGRTSTCDHYLLPVLFLTQPAVVVFPSSSAMLLLYFHQLCSTGKKVYCRCWYVDDRVEYFVGAARQNPDRNMSSDAGFTWFAIISRDVVSDSETISDVVSCVTVLHCSCFF
jgi:hypothetical protein